MNDPFGWDYPAGAENDPDAPWNQKDDAPDDERDMDDASDEECGNLTSPSALAAVHPTQPSAGVADFPSIAGFPSAGVSFSAVSLPSETMPMRVGEGSVVFGVVAPIKGTGGILSGTSDLTTPSRSCRDGEAGWARNSPPLCGRGGQFHHAGTDTMKPTITFDPGLKGGWAIQYQDGVIASGPMPDEGGIIDLVRGFKAGHANGCEAWVEDVPKFTGPMVPGAYVAVLFRNMGFILGALEGMGIRTILCTPQRWQKPLCLGTKAGAGGAAPWKRKLKCEAERRFPSVEVTLLNADALLILDYANANGRGTTNLAS